MGDKWDISIWIPTHEGSHTYYEHQVARGNGSWEEMQAALEKAREHKRPVMMTWRGDME
jgi:hypothetical protein